MLSSFLVLFILWKYFIFFKIHALQNIQLIILRVLLAVLINTLCFVEFFCNLLQVWSDREMHKFLYTVRHSSGGCSSLFSEYNAVWNGKICALANSQFNLASAKKTELEKLCTCYFMIYVANNGNIFFYFLIPTPSIGLTQNNTWQLPDILRTIEQYYDHASLLKSNLYEPVSTQVGTGCSTPNEVNIYFRAF